MIKIVLTTAMAVLSVCAVAQKSIRGKVMDEQSMEPLVGATVVLKEPGRFATSDERGYFQLDVPPGDAREVEVRFVGYVTQSVPVTDDGWVAVLMEQAVQMTDEVVVFATRAHAKTPTTFTNISAQSLQKQNFGQDMPVILNWTPSLVTTSDAGAGVGYTGLRIRGSDATRINVTINGIPYNDSESQGTFWVNIPDIASSTQSVQVQRGVGTSTNGAGAFGGSVNVQTNSLQPIPYAELALAGGSFNTSRLSMKAGTGLINERWAFDGRISRIKSDGYVDRASSDLESYYLTGGYYGKKTMIKAITFGGHEKTYQSWNGIDAETLATNRTFNSAGALYGPDGEVTGYYDNEVDDYRQDHYQLHLTQQLSEYWNANASLHYTYGRGYYEQYKQQKPFAELGLQDIVVGGVTLSAGDFVIRKWLDNQFYGGTFSFNYEKEKASFTLGGAYNEYARAHHFGEIIWAQYASNSQLRQHFYEGESEKADFNTYAKLNYDISPALNAFVDVQYRRVGYKTAGIDDGLFPYDIKHDFNFFNPKAGLSYSVTESDILYGSYAIANREPNRTDFLYGEATQPERLGDLEAGWRKNADNYAFEANYYRMDYRNQLVLTGGLDNVGNPIRSNVGRSYRTGVELSGTARLSSRVSWNANLTWSANRNVDFVVQDIAGALLKVNTTIALSPSWISGSQLNWSPLRNLNVALLSKFVGKQYLNNKDDESMTLDPYFINDLRFSYSFSPKGLKAVDLSLLVNNLFNVEYSSNGADYGVPYYFPQAGINFLGMMTLKF